MSRHSKRVLQLRRTVERLEADNAALRGMISSEKLLKDLREEFNDLSNRYLKLKYETKKNAS